MLKNRLDKSYLSVYNINREFTRRRNQPAGSDFSPSADIIYGISLLEFCIFVQYLYFSNFLCCIFLHVLYGLNNKKTQIILAFLKETWYNI
jgi:hypothetical protein